MFGRGLTRLQPAYVDDVAEAITRALQRTENIRSHLNAAALGSTPTKNCSKPLPTRPASRPKPIRIPFAAWHVLAWFAEMLPNPPITRNKWN